MILENNPFVEMQEQLAALLRAREYFKDVLILTEQVADLAQKVENAILRVGGFGVVITTTHGERHGAADATDLTPLVLTEEIAITVIHSPLMTKKYRALDAVTEAIAAVDGKPSSQPDFTWRVLGHNNDPESRGAVVHHVRVSALHAT
jgi:hypothetical protein